MHYAGIDALLKSSTLYVMDEKGREVKCSTAVTSREELVAGFGGLARRGLRAGVESSGIALCVVGMLKELGGHGRGGQPEPNAADCGVAEEDRPRGRSAAHGIVASGSSARSLHTVGGGTQKGAQLGVRRQLVRQRTALVNQVRGQVRRWEVTSEARGPQTAAGWERVLKRKELPGYVKELAALLSDFSA